MHTMLNRPSSVSQHSHGLIPHPLATTTSMVTAPFPTSTPVATSVLAPSIPSHPLSNSDPDKLPSHISHLATSGQKHPTQSVPVTAPRPASKWGCSGKKLAGQAPGGCKLGSTNYGMEECRELVELYKKHRCLRQAQWQHLQDDYN